MVYHINIILVRDEAIIDTTSYALRALFISVFFKYLIHNRFAYSLKFFLCKLMVFNNNFIYNNEGSTHE